VMLGVLPRPVDSAGTADVSYPTASPVVARRAACEVQVGDGVVR